MTVSNDPRCEVVRWDASDASPRVRRRAVTLMIGTALSMAGFTWWLLQPGRAGNTLLFGVLIAAEAFNMILAAGFWWTCLRRPPARRRAPYDPRIAVDVLIPTYNEPAEIVRATVAAAARLVGLDIRVALLDDGSRDEMSELAAEFGIRCIRRPLHVGAKAGNINHALTITEAPFILILDCDHVPRPDMIRRMLAAFDSESVALVQTPQYYANARTNRIAGAAWGQQALFFGAIARGKDAHGAMFCCGTNVMIRRAPLEAVGGFPETSLTEDFTLSVMLQERGWHTRYLPEVLASGLGPEDLASYVSQQRRWARGCISTIPRIVSARLPIRLKVQYLLSATYFLTGWTTAVYLLMPIAYLFFGFQPLDPVGVQTFLLAFTPYIVLSLATVATLGAGSYTFAAYSLAVSTFWIHLGATLRLFFRGQGRFVVTPKRGSSRRQWRPALPTLVVIAALIGATTFGLARSIDPGTLNNAAFALMHVAILTSGIAVAIVPNLAVNARPKEAIGEDADQPSRV